MGVVVHDLQLCTPFCCIHDCSPTHRHSGVHVPFRVPFTRQKRERDEASQVVKGAFLRSIPAYDGQAGTTDAKRV